VKARARARVRVEGEGEGEGEVTTQTAPLPSEDGACGEVDAGSDAPKRDRNAAYRAMMEKEKKLDRLRKKVGPPFPRFRPGNPFCLIR